MILLIAAVIGLACPALPGLPAHAGSAPASLSTTTVEIRYQLPAAGEVILVWGVNGWRQLPEAMRPPGTVIHQKVMATPMAQKDDSFVLTVPLESGATMEYGFLIKRTARGTPVDVWDGDYAYGPATSTPEIVMVKSRNLYQNPLVLMDRTGMLFVLGLGVMVTALLGIALWSLWSQSRSGAAREPSYHDDVRFAAVVAILAFIIGMVVILHHEMWRDELQAWRIATESRTLSDLLENSRYEGHPLLWYLCLYVLSRVSHDPILMQVFHLGIGVTAIFVICRFAPFTRWQKVCLACGYFFFYEYLILSRNYALGVLALVAFCAIRVKWPDRILTCAVCLALMINTSAFGAMIALACGGWLLLESFRGGDRGRVSHMSRAGVILILAAGMALAMVHTAPPPDNSPRMLGWSAAVLVEPLERTVSAIWKTYVPLPLTLPHFWNTNLLDDMPRLQTILSFGFFVSAALMLRRTPSVMLLYLVATSGLLLFMHFKVNHGIRHTGHLFLVLLACLWLSFSERRVSISGFRHTAVTIGVTLLFASHAVAGALAAATDLALPFSAGKDTAAFIQRRGYADTTLVGSKYFRVSTVANYLDRPMYYAETAHFGTFSRWKGQRSAVAPADLVRTAREMAHVNRKDVLMVVSYDLGVAGETVPLLASFQHSIFTEERYWLYLIPYLEPIGTGGDGI